MPLRSASWLIGLMTRLRTGRGAEGCFLTEQIARLERPLKLMAPWPSRTPQLVKRNSGHRSSATALQPAVKKPGSVAGGLASDRPSGNLFWVRCGSSPGSDARLVPRPLLGR